MNKRLDIFYRLLVEGSKEFGLDKPIYDDGNSQIYFCGNIIKLWENELVIDGIVFEALDDAATYVVSKTLNSKVLHFFGESS